jgi:hypothetical protein
VIEVLRPKPRVRTQCRRNCARAIDARERTKHAVRLRIYVLLTVPVKGWSSEACASAVLILSQTKSDLLYLFDQVFITRHAGS